jgi:ATP-binding protein involved in chromosome partitioning
MTANGTTLEEDAIMAALRGVPHPAGGDIVDAGMVAGVQAEGGAVIVALTAQARFGAQMETVRQAAERAVAALPGVRGATVVLTAERAPDSKKAPQPLSRMPAVKHIIAVASGKGGVGKSTVAVNLAAALAQAGLKTGILDADIYGPSIPRMLGLSGRKPALADEKLQPLSAHGLSVMSIGFMIDEARPLIWRGPMVQSALRQFLEDVEWGGLDVLVVDFPPGTGDVQLTMAQKVPMAGAVVVSTPQDIALLDARKGLAMFAETGVPVLGIVENMSVFVCPRCEHEEHIFGHQGAQAEAARMNVPFLGEIPLHAAVRATCDDGTPIVLSAPDSAAGRAFVAIAQQVAAALAAPRASYAGHYKSS